MSRQEAQEALLLYRPGVNEPEDEQMREALELAQHDPELAAWFEQHCRAQEKIAAAFRGIEIPEGLREQIISERKSHLSRSKRRVLVAACCACALLVIGMAVARFMWPQANNNTFARFRDRIAGEVQRQYPSMDLFTNDLKAAEQYLEQHRGHGDIAVPGRLAQAASTTGCGVFPWHGRNVSMICFNSGKTAVAAPRPDLFLFILKRSEVDAPPANTIPEVKHVRGLITATWTSGDKVYLLGGFGDESFLRKYL